jgi:hypothetical protein
MSQRGLDSDSESIAPIPYEDRAFPLKQAALEGLHVCENTALKLVRSGDLETFRIGRRHLVTGRAIRQCQTRLAARSKRLKQP